MTPASVSASWGHVNAVYRAMTAPKGATALADTVYTPDAADHIAAANSHVVTYVSAPLSAQTIQAQTVQVVARMLEAHANNNLFLAWHVFLISSTGVVGLSLVPFTLTAASELGTTLANRTASATSTSRTCADGDRLCLSLGFGGTPVATSGVQGHNGTINLGESSATDATADNTGTAANNPWLNFATDTIKFTVGQQAASSWDIRVNVGQQAASTWATRAAVGQQAASTWSVAAVPTPPGYDSLSVWGMSTNPASFGLGAWTGALPVAVGAQVDASWNIAATAGQQVASAWAIVAHVGAQADATWAVRAAVGQQAAATWDVRAAVGQQAASTWDVLAIGITAVGQQAASAWNVTALAGQEVASAWNTYVSVGQEVPSSWDITVTAGAQVASAWDLIAHVGAQVASAWATRAAVGQSAAVAWDTAQASVLSLSASPSSMAVGAADVTVALAGTLVNWTPGTPGSPTFTLAGGTGASILSQSVSAKGAATLHIAAGTARGNLTITDPSSGATVRVQVGRGNLARFALGGRFRVGV